MDYSKVDKMPVFMAATPDFVDKNPDTVVAYLKCWQEAGRDFKDNPGKVADVIYAFFTSKGYAMSRETFAKALAKVEVDPGFPSGLQKDAEVLLREKKISAIPDWKKAAAAGAVDEGQGLKQIRPLTHSPESEAPTADHCDATTASARAHSGSMHLIRHGFCATRSFAVRRDADHAGAPARPGGRASKGG